MILDPPNNLIGLHTHLFLKNNNSSHPSMLNLDASGHRIIANSSQDGKKVGNRNVEGGV
jgi:hypothetical protein